MHSRAYRCVGKFQSKPTNGFQRARARLCGVVNIAVTDRHVVAGVPAWQPSPRHGADSHQTTPRSAVPNAPALALPATPPRPTKQSVRSVPQKTMQLRAYQNICKMVGTAAAPSWVACASLRASCARLRCCSAARARSSSSAAAACCFARCAASSHSASWPSAVSRAPSSRCFSCAASHCACSSCCAVSARLASRRCVAIHTANDHA